MSSGGGSSTQVTQQQLSPFVQDIMTRGFNAAQDVAAIPYQAYTGPRIAQFRPQEQQAFQMAEQAATSGLGSQQLAAATEAAQRAAGYSPAQFQQDVSGFMSPYQSQVIDATMARLNQERAKRQNELQAQLASRGAFGNVRRDVVAAEQAGQEDLNTAQMLADLYSKGYTQAAGLAQGLPTQQLAGAAQLAGYGNQAIAQAKALQDMLSGAGQAQRQMAQQNLQLAYEDFLTQQKYPQQQLSILQSGISGMPAPVSSSTTATTPGQGFLGTASDVVSVAAGLKKLFGGNHG